MPRLSLFKPQKGNDYKFIDRRISEMFTVGGVDINLHKYLGPTANPTSTNPNQPTNTTQSVTNIQDVLFLENRDRKYDPDVYVMRTVYRMNDNDFDLSQFGLFLTGDTMFLVFHLNDMIEQLGRKIMVGDVLEFPTLIDLYPLDSELGISLKRFYTVQDATRAAEGFSPTWFPHLWRVKVQPLVDSQEYKDIVNQVAVTSTQVNGANPTTTTVGDLMSTYNKYIAINDAVIARAEKDVPASGYDTSSFYTLPLDEQGMPGNPGVLNTSSIETDASNGATDASASILTSAKKVTGYLTQDALPPNGAHVAAGITFPNMPVLGDYFLRLDYMPNRLFRYSGNRWVKVEDSVRTNLTNGPDNHTQLSSFVNNTEAFMKNSLGWDAIKVASPYIVTGNVITSSFTLSTKQVVTNVAYKATYGVKTRLNDAPITNIVGNTAGNLSFTVSNTLSTNDVLEYTVFANVISQSQGLSNILSPLADN